MNLFERMVPLGIPLAWLNLIKERKRFAAALAGITFAVTLMLFQMGLNSALFIQVVAPQLQMRGDLVMVSPHYEYFGIRRPFPEARLLQAHGQESVETTARLYSINLPIKNPETGVARDIFVIAFDPTEKPWKPGFISEHEAELKHPGYAVFDRLSREEFGQFEALLDSQPTVSTEVNGKAVEVIGTFTMGTTFVADGNLITSLDTFLELFPGGRRSQVDIGLISLDKGADAEAVARQLNERLMDDVRVVTMEAFIADEKAYWSRRTPIGFVIGASMAVALVVGAVIVYQILYTDVNDHLEEYATLKSIGFRDRYFTSLILQESVILSVGGFLPGLGLAALLYYLTRTFAYMPAYLSWEKALIVLVMTLTMCLVAGAFATRKLRQANPADIF